MALISVGGANVVAYRDVTFDATDFTGVGGVGAWTVTSDDPIEWAFAAVGRVALVRLTLVNTETCGTVALLQVKNPFNTAAVVQFTTHVRNGGAVVPAVVTGGAGSMVVARADGANFSTAGQTSLWIHHAFPITT